MKKLNVKKRKEKKLIGNKAKHYIILGIIACCLIVSINIHPTNNESISNNPEMIYVFHDYERNQYILNDQSHGSAEELNFLFDDTVPNTIKGEYNYTENGVSLENLENNDINDNQISIEDIMNELGINDEYSGNIVIVDESGDDTGIDENTLIIDLSNTDTKSTQNKNENQYNISNDGTILTIKKSRNTIIKNNNYLQNNDSIDSELVVKDFRTISENRFLPSLIPRDEISDPNSIYIKYSENYYDMTEYEDWNTNKGGINILPDYKDCITPRGYKISHGESVLAYKQVDNAPNICNIERRFCRNGKLSGTYPQQGCSVNENYSYTQRTDLDEKPQTINSYTKNTKSEGSFSSNKNPTIELATKQNDDGSVTVYKPETTGSFVFDRPSQSYTEADHLDDNIKESPEVIQTKKEHKSCLTPRGEEVSHGQIVQAFKHANGFSDIPCQAQIRLCSMGELDGSYKQKSCKKREYSFADRYNGSANNDKYYKEKLKKIKQKIKYEEEYYKEIKGLSEEEALDKIFYLLDE